MTVNVKVTREGMRAALSTSAVQGMVDRAAAKIASNTLNDTHDGPAEVRVEQHSSEITAIAAVTIAHPAGVGLQTKYGALSNAATSIGAGFKGRGRHR